jgi:ankyrin repeat protein
MELKDNWGRTALFWPLSKDKPRFVRALLEAGADANTKDVNGVTVLYQALAWGMYDTADEFIAHGADVNGYSGNNYPETALHYCVMKDKPECVRFLLDRGASPYLEDAYGYTVFERVRLHDHIGGAVGALLHKRKPRTEPPGNDGR